MRIKFVASKPDIPEECLIKYKSLGDFEIIDATKLNQKEAVEKLNNVEILIPDDGVKIKLIISGLIGANFLLATGHAVVNGLV
ncbi:MAG: hypothetical protein U9N83_06145 [Thermodesulfobacteriota bacterium]|nr:hypothetical protein [Thermodesulfobacteriota bacterium]